MKRTLIVLHGSRQTGDLFLGRIAKLQKNLEKEGINCVAPTGSFCVDESAAASDLRQWWIRSDDDPNRYHGFEDTTVPQLMELWERLVRDEAPPCGFLGFSQGSRLAHLCAVLHSRNPKYFPGLRLVVLVAGYDAPLESSIPRWCPLEHHRGLQAAPHKLSIPSLHVWGETDALVLPEQTQANRHWYTNHAMICHSGGHHVPMQAEYRRQMVDFILAHANEPGVGSNKKAASTTSTPTSWVDAETKQLQQEEVEALQAIFPDQIHLLQDDLEVFPIQYTLRLVPPEEDDDDNDATAHWPPLPLSWLVSYDGTYPSEGSGPLLTWRDSNNVFQFSSAQRAACDAAVQQAVDDAAGIPCVFAAYTAVQDFFQTQHAGSGTTSTATSSIPDAVSTEQSSIVEDGDGDTTTTSSIIPSSTPERIAECQQQGLKIAASILRTMGNVGNASVSKNSVIVDSQVENGDMSSSEAAPGKGGSWNYTIGLVGKPSAGKSTFFNAATGFARQRDDAENALGGASMAPHPFTTIDANLGFAWVPAPLGLCPEDDLQYSNNANIKVGSTHGRDAQGRRLLPVLLKDVAGLVPGAYQGRGRGNKFLNDLTSADALVHVLDASGTADVEGNDLGVEADGSPSDAASHPLKDMEWIRAELIQWVHANLMFKWQSIARKGRSKLEGMFSGYGQNQALLARLLNAVERSMQEHEKIEHPMENVHMWDEGAVHRLVSTFLGVRFPMVLALNKSDLPTSTQHIADIQKGLPLHGAYAAIPVCARKEMLVIKHHLECSLEGNDTNKTDEFASISMAGVASCLTSALSLREPVLVFPVTNFDDYAPLPALSRYATSDASLPNRGMCAYLNASGGEVPSLFNPGTMQYMEEKQKNSKQQNYSLRDVFLMKPGSTVEDVFIALKNRRALEGDFVRAEAAAQIGEPSRPVPKHMLLQKSNRILRIMTTKKVAWQQR